MQDSNQAYDSHRNAAKEKEKNDEEFDTKMTSVVAATLNACRQRMRKIERIHKAVQRNQGCMGQDDNLVHKQNVNAETLNLNPETYKEGNKYIEHGGNCTKNSLLAKVVNIEHKPPKYRIQTAL